MSMKEKMRLNPALHAGIPRHFLRCYARIIDFCQENFICKFKIPRKSAENAKTTYILHYRNLFKYTYLVRIMETGKIEQFEHKISQGSRFNQIYIPKEMEEIFEVGDIVQVRLLKKKEQLHYSKTLKKLS